MKLCAYIVKLWVLIPLTMLAACGPSAEEQRGRELAERHCTGCHLLPEPALLDKKTWQEGVLPIMGVYLGLFPEEPTPSSQSFYHDYLDSGVFPDQPLVSEADWQLLKAYYENLAPEKLVAKARNLRPGQQFEIGKKPPSNGVALPATTHVFWDKKNSQLWVADNIARKIFIQNAGGARIDSLPQKTPVSAIASAKSGGYLVTQIGTIAPGTEEIGALNRVTRNPTTGLYQQETLMRGLHRPTQTLVVDIDRDGQAEFVICEFGFLAGQLAYWKNDSLNEYRSHVISPEAGALKCVSTDWNGDGWPDLVALFGQGDERISVFINQKTGRFKERILQRFPPSYGSVDFDLQDFDRDGRPDLLYVCGDNADYSRILKPYHGIYIFRNEGEDAFEQKFFFPINGAYRAQVDDFDQDGDLDIATLSFFADYDRTPQESFVYLVADGAFDFDAFTVAGAATGRWITLDTGDVDGDGDSDIILGNCAAADGYEGRYNPLWIDSPPYLILKNTLKNNGKIAGTAP